MKKITKNSLALGIFIVVMSVVFLINRSALKKPIAENKSIPIVATKNTKEKPKDKTPSSNEIKNDTVNWKIYRHPVTGITLKYPPHWQAISNDATNYFGFDIVENKDTCFDLGCKGPGIVVEMLNESTSDHIQSIRPPTQKILSQEDLIINGKQFTKLLLEQISGYQNYRYLYEDGDSLFLFDSENNPQYLEILDEMLSTFQLDHD